MAGRTKKTEKCLTVQDVLRFAVQREIEAAQGYGEMARKTKDPSLKTLLLELQSDEQNHRKLLEDLAAANIVPWMTGNVEDLRISDYLIEEPLGEGSGFQGLLIFAAKKEAKAIELYARLRDECPRPEQKRLFEFLIQQEKSHKLKLEKEYETYVLQED
jgi:rubrerythrin